MQVLNRYHIAERLGTKYKSAVADSCKANEQIEDMEATLSGQGAPLTVWKAQEAEFLQDVIAPDARRRVLKSPYAAQEDKG